MKTFKAFAIFATANTMALSPSYGQVVENRTYAESFGGYDEMVDAAKAIAKSAALARETWPGFWPDGQAFIVVSAKGGRVIVAPQGFEGETSKVDLGDGLWLFQRPPAEGEKGSMTFAGAETIDGTDFYVLPAKGKTLDHRIEFYFHEAFHFDQLETFARNPEDRINGLSPIAFLDDPAFVTDPEFLDQLRKEELQLKGIAASSGDLAFLVPVVKRYFQMRDARLSDKPQLLAIERRYERQEGSATYVGCTIAAKAVFASDVPDTFCLMTPIIKQTDRFDDEVFVLRWRLYGSGAIMARALDSLAVPDWRGRLANGENLDDMLREAVSS